MNTSLIINPNAFRAELWMSFWFFRSLNINSDNFVCAPSYEGGTLSVSLYKHESNASLDEIDRVIKENDPFYRHKIQSVDFVALKSIDPKDYYLLFNAEKILIESSLQKMHDTNPENTTWFSLGEIPIPEDDEQSVNIILDVNGEGQYFDTGWYSYESKKWVNCNRDFDRAITEHPELARWSYGPKGLKK